MIQLESLEGIDMVELGNTGFDTSLTTSTPNIYEDTINKAVPTDFRDVGLPQEEWQYSVQPQSPDYTSGNVVDYFNLANEQLQTLQTPNDLNTPLQTDYAAQAAAITAQTEANRASKNNTMLIAGLAGGAILITLLLAATSGKKKEQSKALSGLEGTYNEDAIVI